MNPEKVRVRHIANAFILLAKANHYMLNFKGPVTLRELELAKQYLIIEENDADNTEDRETLKLALDMLEEELKGLSI
jgi:hypothetical protein